MSKEIEIHTTGSDGGQVVPVRVVEPVELALATSDASDCVTPGDAPAAYPAAPTPTRRIAEVPTQ